MDMFLSAEQIKRWGLKGGIAILDQGVFSSANFVMTIVLARWLAPEQYGAYAVGFSALIFFMQFLFNYIVEPMGVIGTSSYNENLADYLAAQVRLYFIVIGCLGLSVVLGILVFGQFSWNPLLFNVFIVIGLSLTSLLLPWMLRRVFYILRKPHVSLAGSIIYAGVLLLIIYLANLSNFLTSTSSVLAVAAAGALSGLFMIFKLNRPLPQNPSLSTGNVLRENWHFGRWLVISGMLMALASQAPIFLTGSILGLEETGVVYALQVLSQPMTLSVTAITALVTPSLAFDYSRSDFKAFRGKAFSMTIALVGMAVLFELFLIFFRVPIEQFLYNGKFANYVDLIPIWGLCPLITSLVSGMQYSLQAAKRPDLLFIASLFWLPASFGFGIIMIHVWGLWGAAWSIVLGYAALGIVVTFLYWHRLIKPSNLVVHI